MNNKLMELLKDSPICDVTHVEDIDWKRTVDFLITSAVLVQPCRVGQTVYIIDEPEFGEPYVLGVKVSAVGQDRNGTWITLDLPLGFKQSQYVNADSIGKTLFLSEKAAEHKITEERKSL